MDWKIYYTDDSTFSSENGLWDDAPLDGVVCVVVTDPDYGRYVLNGLNYYYAQVDGSLEDKAHCNDIGPQLRVRCPWLKFGVGTAREKWKRILIKATKDPDFPRPRNPQRRSTDKEI